MTAEDDGPQVAYRLTVPADDGRTVRLVLWNDGTVTWELPALPAT